MRRRAVFALLLAGSLVSPTLKLSADDESIFDRIRREHESIEKHCRSFVPLSASAQPGALQPVDVKHYRLQITLDPPAAAFSGQVTITGEATSVVSSVTVDAAENIVIDSVKLSGVSAQFVRSTDR